MASASKARQVDRSRGDGSGGGIEAASGCGLAGRMAASWTGSAGSRSAWVAEGARGRWARYRSLGRERGGVYRVCVASPKQHLGVMGDRRPAVAGQDAACAPGRPASTTKRAAVDTGLFASHGEATLRSSTWSRSARSSKRM